MRWHYLQHVPFEGPSMLGDWASQRGHTLTNWELWRSSELPDLKELDGLFILGGPMNVYEYDRYPWLSAEQQFIEAATARGLPILGVCLGAQLLSVALGGAVMRMPEKEIGWFPVELTAGGRACGLFDGFPNEFTAFHWHGDTFSIPPGATQIGRSRACEAQGFVYQNRVVGLQFHLECDRAAIAAMIEHGGGDLGCGRYVQEPGAMEHCNEYIATTRRLLVELLDRMCAHSTSDCA
jgi:GMP synthase (glutamine-hydrolysing)